MASGENQSAKRPATSPLQDEGKRPCTMDASFVSSGRDDDDDDTVIVNPEFLTSTILESPVGAGQPSALRSELKAVLTDPGFLDLIASAVADRVSANLRQEVSSLREQLVEKEKQIVTLQDQIDDLEQYSRRNCVRISSIPESPTEDTNSIAKAIAESVGVTLTDDAIDRSHRIGRKAPGFTLGRPIIVKLTSYRHKEALMRARRGLMKVDADRLFPDHSWPSLPKSSPSSKATSSHRIFINDDLTKVRSQVAAKARQLKREKRIDDTWVRDGVVYVRNGDNKTTHTTIRGVEALAARRT